MKRKQMNFKFLPDLYEEIQATAKKSNSTITELIVEGAKKELIFRKIRDELGQPETLVIFDKAKGIYQGEPEYRKKFLKKFIDALERKIPIL